MITTNPYAKRTAVRGRVVAVLELKLLKRALQLIPITSRALIRGSIVEVLCTDEAKAGPQRTVNRTGAVAFFEVDKGGIARVGDKIRFAGRNMGQVVGFDETHSPNHMNLVILTKSLTTGVEQRLKLGDRVVVSG